MKTNGTAKHPMTPTFWVGEKRFIVTCGRFDCIDHAGAMEAGKELHPNCKFLNFTGATAKLPVGGEKAMLGTCPILLIEED